MTNQERREFDLHYNYNIREKTSRPKLLWHNYYFILKSKHSLFVRSRKIENPSPSCKKNLLLESQDYKAFYPLNKVASVFRN